MVFGRQGDRARRDRSRSDLALLLRALAVRCRTARRLGAAALRRRHCRRVRRGRTRLGSSGARSMARRRRVRTASARSASEVVTDDASRLLASASIAIQQVVGIDVEPVLADAGPDGARGGRRVRPAWSSWGCRHAGGERASGRRGARSWQAVSSTLVVHRGARPGGLAPREQLTRFTWTHRRGRLISDAGRERQDRRSRGLLATPCTRRARRRTPDRRRWRRPRRARHRARAPVRASNRPVHAPGPASREHARSVGASSCRAEYPGTV